MQTFALLCAMSVGAAIVIAKPSDECESVPSTKPSEKDAYSRSSSSRRKKFDAKNQ